MYTHNAKNVFHLLKKVKCLLLRNGFPEVVDIDGSCILGLANLACTLNQVIDQQLQALGDQHWCRLGNLTHLLWRRESTFSRRQHSRLTQKWLTRTTHLSEVCTRTVTGNRSHLILLHNFFDSSCRKASLPRPLRRHACPTLLQLSPALRNVSSLRPFRAESKGAGRGVG